MSMTRIDDTGVKRGAIADAVAQVPVWLWLAAGVFLMLFLNGSVLLSDSDTYWQITIGQSILDHHALPQVDSFSFTKAGEPWMSSSWLSQVLFAESYRLAGWAGPAALTALAAAAAIALVFDALSRHFRLAYALLPTLAVLILSMPHFWARPHVLVMPVMVLWMRGLIAAADDKRAPSPGILALIALWANMHGSFVFGLMLIAPLALETVWTAQAAQRKKLFLQWFAFGVCALGAVCLTPYGWGSLLASRKILDLGEVLTVLNEWRSPNFNSFGAFEACILAAIGGALYRGITLPPFRILLLLGLLHMALAHVRNVELFALLAPLVVAGPLSQQLGESAAHTAATRASFAASLVVAVLVAVAGTAIALHQRFEPPVTQSPIAALQVLQDKKAERILNDLPFGGYMIWKGVPVFVDGRSELYGEKFVMNLLRGVALLDVERFLTLLQTYRVDATLLPPSAAAVGLLDRLDGWERVYADGTAVAHMRKPGATSGDAVKLKSAPR